MQSENSNEQYVVIVGGGLAGLTAASLLAAAGEKVLVVEKEEDLGGLARSFVLDDIIFDLGPHLFFFNPDFRADRFCKELFTSDELLFNRYRWAIQSKGKYWNFPFSPIDILLSYPLNYKIEIIKSIFGKAADPDSDERSLEFALAKKTGPSFFNDVFNPMTRQKVGLTGDVLHRDWSLRVDRDVKNRIKKFTGFDKELSFKKKLENLLAPKYYYPKNGAGMLIEKLTEKCRKTGVQFMTSCPDISISYENDKVSSVKIGEREVNTKNLIWTAPPELLLKKLNIKEDGLESADLAIVFTTFNRVKMKKRPYVFTYHTEEKYCFNRIYFPDSIFHASLLPDREGVCAEVLLDKITGKKSDTEIIQDVVGGLEDLDLFRGEKLREARVIRLPNCIPIYRLDYREKLEAYFSKIRPFSNVFSIGRSGGHFFCLTPMAINQGIQMAEHILKDKVI